MALRANETAGFGDVLYARWTSGLIAPISHISSGGSCQMQSIHRQAYDAEAVV